MSSTASVAAEMADSDNLEEEVTVPYTVSDVTLMSPGTWNGMDYNTGEIEQAFERTDWKDERKHNAALFLDHEDRSAEKHVGKVVNLRMEGDDLKGDLEVVDKQTAIKIAYGAKFGISPKVQGRSSDGRTMEDFTFENFSVVVNPAVKTTYLNQELQQLAEDKQKEFSDEQIAELAEELGVDIDTTEQVDIIDLFSQKVEQIQGESSMAQEDTTQEPEDAEVAEEAEAQEENPEEQASAEAETDAETESEMDADVDTIVDAVMSKVDERFEEFENSDEEDEDDEDAADEDAEADEAEAENADDSVEDDDVAAEDIDSFQEFAADYRADNPEAALSEIVEEYEEEQKDVDTKVDEKVSAVKSEMEERISALEDALDSKQQEIEEMSQKVEEAPSRASVKDGSDTRKDVVKELSDKDSEDLDKMFMAALHKKQGTESILRGER